MAFIILTTTGTAIIIIGAVELLKLNKKIFGAMLIVAISFIYLGFAESFNQLIIESVIATSFFFLAYLGLTKNWKLIPITLVLHGLWDLIHTRVLVDSNTPKDYEFFCIIVDLLLAFYIFLSLSKQKNNEKI